MAHYHDTLMREIFALSDDRSSWRAAVNEWRYVSADKCAGQCICTHSISHQYNIVNVVNGNTAVVGCVCVTNFMADNTALVSGVKAAVRNMNKQPCTHCGEPITMPKVAHARCIKDAAKAAARQQERDAANPRMVAWKAVRATIDFSQLSEREVEFIESLDTRMRLWPTTPKQKAWLRSILQRQRV